MVELILTNTLDSAPILDCLKSRVGEGRKHILFVPDRFSLSYQKAVLEHLNIKGTFDIEVSSFPRLANKLLKDKKRLLDKQSEVMLLRKVIEDNKEELLCFGKLGRSPQFANDMYAVISQIRNSNIPVERMQAALDGMPKRIANKTKDIVKIYHDYVQYIQDDYSDGTSKLQALCDLIYKGALNDYEVYVSDFTSFSNIEYDIIKAIMANAPNTHICLVDSDGDNSQVFPKDVKGRLFSLAQEVGINMKVSCRQEKLSGDAYIIFKGLYSYGKVDGKSDDRTQILACKSIQDEVKTLARTINRLVKNGARYRDMAVVCCDFAVYTPYIKSIFKACDVPYYADIKQSLSCQALTRLLVSALQTVGEKYSQSSVLQFAKQRILGLDYDDVCIFDNYCCRYGKEFTMFFSPFDFGEDLERAESVRQRIINLLSPLNANAKAIKEHTQAVRDFLDGCKATELVENLAKWQEDNGFGELSSITLQSIDKLNSILDKCDNALGETWASLEEFLGILTTAIDSVEMSNIPLYSDCVFIGEPSANRYANLDYMFVIGANVGKFPPEHTDGGIVSEREYVAWSNMNIDVQPDCRRRNAKERLSTLMLLTRARKRLVISYPTASASGDELAPSSTVEYVSQLLGLKPTLESTPDASWDRAEYIDYISSQGNILQEFLSLQALATARAIDVSDTLDEVLDILYTLCVDKYGKEYIDFLIGEKSQEVQIDGIGDIMFNGSKTSVSQFEKYFKCPFLHFNENALKLSRKLVAGLEVSDMGTLLHAVMCEYFKLEDCADKSEGKIERLVPDMFVAQVKASPEYAFLLDGKKNNLVMQQLTKQAVYVVKKLVENMRVTKFRPAADKLEVRFGTGKDAKIPGMRIDNGVRKLNFNGVIDRVDTYGDKAIIIDYKSKGNIHFDPSNIFYGDRVQLFIYLNALRASGNITPQGVFYLLMNNRFVKKDKDNRFMHRGFVNVDDVSGLDVGLEDNSKYVSSVYPVSCDTQDGKKSYKEVKSYGHVMVGKGFDDTCDYVMKLTSLAAREIEEGYIAKSPLNINGEDEAEACRYCNYKDLCARSKTYVRNVKKLTQEEYDALLKDDNKDEEASKDELTKSTDGDTQVAAAVTTQLTKSTPTKMIDGATTDTLTKTTPSKSASKMTDEAERLSKACCDMATDEV